MYEALTAMAFNQLLWEFAHIFLHFKNFVYSCLHAEIKKKKKKQIPNGMSKHFIHWLIYGLFYSSPRKKQNWKNRRIGQMSYNVFNKELVSQFFPVNLSAGQFFVTAEDRHLWNVSETLKEFTLPVIFSSFSQQRNRHC